MSNYPKPINDSRLSSDMERVRAGSTQLFRVPKRGDLSFINNENADVVLIPPEKHIYAELIDGTWHWVNGCAECNGQPRDWMTYIECDKHNVCRTCQTPRSEISGPAWGGKHGWQCDACNTREHEAEKAAALEAMPDDFCETDYRYMDSIKCPYCDAKHDETDMHSAIDHEETVECWRCDNEFTVSGEVSVTWTTSRTEREQTA